MASRRVFFWTLVAVVSMGMASVARADSYSAVVVYGDSLSDDGNLYAADAGTYPPSPPYYEGRFSNGPVAVEQLATLLGAPLDDFAFAGATSGVGNYIDGGTQTSTGALGLPGLEAEVAESSALLSSPLVSSSLFVVWGGANDFLIDGSPSVGAADIDSIVATLEADGAQHILVPGVPDLGLTPDYYGDSAATAFAEEFNADLLAGLPAGATYFDTFDLLDSINGDPSAYGLTNVTTPCLNGVVVCSDPSQYLFWDGFHPTTAADALLAEDFDAALTPSATPEPSALVLAGTGLLGLLGLVRRRRPLQAAG